jgi:hypothetical protein
MFGLELPASQLLYSTVLVVATLADGETATGTAFFYQWKVDTDRSLLVLVTNKHVVAGAKTVKFLVHEAVVNKETGKREPGTSSFELTAPGDFFIGHPGDVDLSAMPFEPLKQLGLKQGKEVFSIALSEELIASDDQLQKLSALEDVVMVGYPIGLSDMANNFPIIRKGITASHPYTDFNAKPWGAVDIASFPGSSGSPVLLFNDGLYRGEGGGMVMGSRALFLGVLFGGPQLRADGTFDIREIPTGKVRVPVVVTSIPIHLGFYVKAKELKVLKEHLIKMFNIH